jgi:hypothetical protein
MFQIIGAAFVVIMIGVMKPLHLRMSCFCGCSVGMLFLELLVLLEQ